MRSPILLNLRKEETAAHVLQPMHGQRLLDLTWFMLTSLQTDRGASTLRFPMGNQLWITATDSHALLMSFQEGGRAEAISNPHAQAPGNHTGRASVTLKSISKHFMQSVRLHFLSLLLGGSVQPSPAQLPNCHKLLLSRTASTQWALNTCMPNELRLLHCSERSVIDCSSSRSEDEQLY